jgi:hypothetical protein
MASLDAALERSVRAQNAYLQVKSMIAVGHGVAFIGQLVSSSATGKRGHAKDR